MTTIPIITLDAIQASMSKSDILNAVKEALIAHSKGQIVSPLPGQLLFDAPKGDCHIKYGYFIGGETYVVKVASGFYDNPKLGLPVNNGIMMVFSAKTGAPVCVLDDKGWLTNIRTAAAGALAAQAGAPEQISSLGIIGAGEQAELQARWSCDLLGINAINVYARSLSKAKAYAERLKQHDINVTISPDIPTLLKNCNLVITTTPSNNALIHASDVQPGTHIVAMGTDSPGKQELDAALFQRAAVIMVDDHDQCVHHGDYGHAVRGGFVSENSDIALGTILAGEKPGRLSEEDITIADLTGIAAEDLAVAGLAWNNHT
ncbi:MAG: ornithine cyclodeaminase [Halopseudomonas aestusnigri]